MNKRFFLAALLLTLALLACCSVALAVDDVPPAEMISDNPNFSSVEWYQDVMPLADEEFGLSRTTASISKSDSTHVAIRGVTQANAICYLIGGTMVVQRWKDNQWNYYTSASYKDRSTNKVSGDIVLAVESGYYYRLVLNHYAHHDNDSAYAVSTTYSVLVK